MSISYSSDLQKITVFTFLKIIFKWRGSIYKSIWKETIFLSLLSLLLTLLLKYVIIPDKTPFAYNICKILMTITKEGYSRVPIVFVLGFYVSFAVVRWYSQMRVIPWPDTTAIVIATCIEGKDEKAIKIRRQIMRYLTVSFLIAAKRHMQDIRSLISDKDDFINSGLLNEKEWDILTNQTFRYSKYFILSNWAINLVIQAQELRYIHNDVIFDYCINKISDYRNSLATLFLFDYLNPPLVYTQVAGMAVYVYIYGAVVAYQDIDMRSKTGLSKYLPPFELFLYLFYLAWYKIAEELANPFGNTDSSFDIVYLAQRNLSVSFLFVDQLQTNHPPMIPVEQYSLLYGLLNKSDYDKSENSSMFSSSQSEYSNLMSEIVIYS